MKFETVVRCSTANVKSKDSKHPNFGTFGASGIALVIHGDQEFFAGGKNYKLTLEDTDLDLDGRPRKIEKRKGVKSTCL